MSSVTTASLRQFARMKTRNEPRFRLSQPVFRLGSAVFETVVAVLLLIPKTARLGAGLIVVWMTTVILSHIFVLGYGWFFVDALVVMVLAVIYLLLTGRLFPRGESDRRTRT
jgi:chromate transport protein ChrA